MGGLTSHMLFTLFRTNFPRGVQSTHSLFFHLLLVPSRIQEDGTEARLSYCDDAYRLHYRGIPQISESSHIVVF